MASQTLMWSWTSFQTCKYFLENNLQSFSAYEGDNLLNGYGITSLSDILGFLFCHPNYLNF